MDDETIPRLPAIVVPPKEETLTDETVKLSAVKKPEPEPETDISARAAKLREEMRNGRRDTQAAKPFIQDTGASHSSNGRSSQTVPGTSERASEGAGHGYGAYRGTQEKSIGERSADRRSGQDNSLMEGNVPGATRRTAGRLATDEPIQERFEERKPPERRYRGDYKQSNRNIDGKSQKCYVFLADTTQAILPKDWQDLPSRKQEQREQAQSARAEVKAEAKPEGKGKRGFLGIGGKEGSVLSKAEVNSFREPLVAALKDDFKYLDEALWWYSKDANQPQIWSNMDDEERETVATFFLKRGERSPAAANFVRNVVDSNEYINTAVIMVPRLIQTTQQMSKRPKQPREKRKRSA